jgi:phosphoenolpyruvate carboxylase
LADLEKKLYNNLFVPGQITDITQKEILKTLDEIRDILIYKHNSLFLHLVNNLKNKVEIFGLHFASLDVRQESSVHGNVIESFAGKVKEIPVNYSSLSEDEKIKILSNLQPVDPSLVTGDEIKKILLNLSRS